MPWQPVGPDRWDYDEDDPERHLMLNGNGVLAELHGQWLHKYQAPASINAAAPLDGADYVSTRELRDPITTDEQGWQLLADAVKET